MTPHLGRLAPPRLARYVARRAEGGVAMIVLPAGQAIYGHPAYPAEIATALADGYADPDGVGYHVRDPRHRDYLTSALTASLARLAQAAHSGGALIIGQIHHPGAERSWDNFQATVAPSAIRADASAWMPHALSAREIADLVAAYGQTAEAIIAAGMDGVEVHAGHGYLLNRFLSPYYNRRTDAYGGSAAARRLLLTQILAEIRQRIGPEPLLGVRLPAAEEVEGGLTSAEVAEIAAAISDPLSYLSVSLGNHDGIRDGRPATAYTAPWLTGPPPAVDPARLVRSAVDRPLIVTGRITSAAVAEEILATGAADLVGVARALIADPDFAAKATTGRGDEIDQCVGVNECTLVPFSCPVNPDAGREAAAAGDAQTADGSAGAATGRGAGRPARRRRVVVVGAGPAGVHAATRAADRGHDVILLDEAEAVGGTLRRLSAAPNLAAWAELVRSLQRRVARSTVTYRPGVRAGVAEVLAQEPDVVVVATGSVPVAAGFAADRPVLSGLDILAGAGPAAPPDEGAVVVVGGAEPHLEPLLVADALRSWGRPIVLVTEHRAIGPDVEPRTLNALLGRLFQHECEIVPMTRVVGWQDGMVQTTHLFSGRARAIPAAAVVTALGRTASDGLAAELEASLDPTVPIYVAGDAYAPRRVTHAVLEGARYGSVL